MSAPSRHGAGTEASQSSAAAAFLVEERQSQTGP
jgi:hypothetical protein